METQSSKSSTAKTIKHIIIYFLLFLAGDLFSGLAFDLLFSVVVLPIRGLYSILRVSGCLALTYYLFWLYTTKILHLKMSDFRITYSIKKWGILYAVLLPTFVVLCFLVIGKTEVTTLGADGITVAVMYSIIAGLKAGILEEMLFRGYIMKLLEERWNKSVAIILPSFFFSLVHIPSMEEFSIAGTLLVIISGTLVGIMFSLIAYKGDSISNGSLIHFAWNFVMVTDIFHITTMQGAYGEPVLSIIIPSDSVLVTGAGFGVEASIIAIIGYLLVCGATALRKRNK